MKTTAEAIRSNKDQTNPPCVAIVDDDWENAELLAEWLADRGMEAVAYKSAEEALQHDLQHCSAIIMDMHLPGMLGCECGYHLREIGYDAPIIAVTGNYENWDMSDLKDLGFSCILKKPLDLNKLLQYLPGRL